MLTRGGTPYFAKKVPHSWDCMDAHMLPCRCGADEHNARPIPPGQDH